MASACSPAFVSSSQAPETLLAVRSSPAPTPWDRRPRESASAFRAFCVYRDMGTDRSLERVALQLGLALHKLVRLARDFGWRGRVEASDLALLDLAKVRSVESRLMAADRHAQLAQSLVATAAKRASRLLPEELDVDALVKVARTGVELERLARGERNEGAPPAQQVAVGVAVRFGSAEPSWMKQSKTEAKGTSSIVGTSNRGNQPAPGSLRESTIPKLPPKETKRIKSTSRLAAKVHKDRKVKGPVQ